MPKLNLSELEQPTRSLDEERLLRRERRKAADARQTLEAAIKQIDALERQVDLLLALDDRKQREAWDRPKSCNKGEATIVFLWSDWHVEQVVSPSEVNGLNRWGPRYVEPARRQLVDRSLNVVLPRYRQAAKIDEAVIWLGGDFIENDTRDEQKTRTAMTPIRAAQFAESLLERTLHDFADGGDFKRITVVTSTGNHDRTTEKMWAGGRNDTSFATLIYDHLRKLFRGHPKIQWQAEEGEMTYLDVYDYRTRFVHGDSIKYRGGRDGLSGPAAIQINKWNSSRHADFTFFGDKHTYLWNDQHDFVANGAMCGPAPYSLRYGRNRACQAVAVIDRKHGLTDSTKIFCR